MHIVIFSDSLGRARPDLAPEDRTRFPQTYGYQLREHFRGTHDIEIAYVESLDSEMALHWSQRMVAYREPDLVIYHFGINDAAPRVFRKNSRSLLLKPWFRKLSRDKLMRLVGRFRRQITKFHRITYTSPQEFRANLESIRSEVLKYNPDTQFIGVSIARPRTNLAQRSFNYTENVDTYNSVISDVFGTGYVDVNALLNPEDLLISDSLHLTPAGHTLLAEALAEQIENRIQSQGTSAS